MLGCFLRFAPALLLSQFLVLLMETAILGDLKDVNVGEGKLKQRGGGGGGNGEEESCGEGEERDNCPWVSEDGKQ